MLPVITDRNSKVRTIIIWIISITTYSNNGVFSILFDHRYKRKFVIVVDVGEAMNPIFGKSMKRKLENADIQTGKKAY